jgi:nitroreductase
MLRETIHESQKCQRNWDLSQQIREKDKDLIIEAATNSPSKQNLNFFKLHVIEDRDTIEQIHEHTRGFGPIYKNYDANKSPKKLSEEGISHYEEGDGDGEWYTNSQVLGQMLLAFTKNEPTQIREENESYDEDRAMAIGISAGYVNLIATQLGYSTGCCKCMDSKPVEDILGEAPILLMGVGVSDKTRDRREHHYDPTFTFPSLKALKDVHVERHPA